MFFGHILSPLGYNYFLLLGLSKYVRLFNIVFIRVDLGLLLVHKV